MHSNIFIPLDYRLASCCVSFILTSSLCSHFSRHIIVSKRQICLTLYSRMSTFTTQQTGLICCSIGFIKKFGERIDNYIQLPHSRMQRHLSRTDFQPLNGHTQTVAYMISRHTIITRLPGWLPRGSCWVLQDTGWKSIKRAST